VRGAAIWAMAQLCDPQEMERLASQRRGVELDAMVSDEWRLAREMAGHS